METRVVGLAGRLLIALAWVVLSAPPAVLGQEDVAPPDFNALLQNLMKANPQGEKVPALINFRVLKEALPPALPGLKRTGAAGETTGAFGMHVSSAEGVYEGGEGTRITITYTDMGGMKGVAAMAKFGWAAAEIDRETEEEREFTTEVQGNKAHYRYNTRYHKGELQMMAGERLMVEVRASKADAEQLQQAIDALPVKKLAALTPDSIVEEKTTPGAGEAGPGAAP